MEPTLSYRSNACPLCLACLKCNKIYGDSCSCESIVLYWGRHIEESKNFRTKTLTQEAAKKRSNKFDPEFASWFWLNVSPNLEISSNLSVINICKKCLNKYDYIKGKKKKEFNNAITENLEEEIITVDLTQRIPSSTLINKEKKNPTFVSLVCFNQYQQPHKKLDGALSIPFHLDEVSKFVHIEEEILSRQRPTTWGKIEMGLICYQLSSALKADHFEINSPDTVSAFISAVKSKKNVQLCVYQEKPTQKKHTLYGSSVVNESNSNKRLDVESETTSEINQIKERIYKNLKTCAYHIQGCLISEDGRHLKLNGEMVTMWARSIISEISGVDENTPPSIPVFDKNKYRFPSSKQTLSCNTNNMSEDATPINVPIRLPIVSKLQTITIHTRKRSPFKTNIQVIKGMSFQDLITFAFPMGPPEGKRFIVKSSLDIEGKVFLSEQIIEEVFFENHVQLWIDIEKTAVNFNDLFDDDDDG